MLLTLPPSDSVFYLPDMERLQAEMEPSWIWGSEDVVCAQREDLAARYSSLQQVGKWESMEMEFYRYKNKFGKKYVF